MNGTTAPFFSFSLCYTYSVENQVEFLGIGDIVTDAFIKLKEAEVKCDARGENCRLSLRFKDKIPYESVTVVPAVGNSPNAAVTAARLGLRAALLTNLGDDENGAAALAALQANGVATTWVKQHAGQKTNYHYVLWFGDDRTILIKHEEYPYELPLDFARGKPPAWVYLSSLGEHSLTFHQPIADYLAAQPEIKLAFQPGTYQIKFGAAALAAIYRRTDIFFSNLEEAQRILATDEATPKKLLAGIRTLGPKIAVITDGKKGAYASDGAQTLFMPPYPDPKPPLERTGAGDAFSATVTAALAIGLQLAEALRWGPVNSMSVVQQIGAQAGLLTRAQLENYLKTAPTDYQPHEV